MVAEQRLLGHFADKEYDLTTMKWRNEDEIIKVTPVRKQPFTGAIYVLIDSRSASASEIAARTLQIKRDATVIGDRSMGAVMTSISRGLSVGAGAERVLDFGLQLAISDFILPGGERLEHKGVLPNVAALPTPEDLRDGRDPVLAAALDLAGVKMSAADAGKIWVKK